MDGKTTKKMFGFVMKKIMAKKRNKKKRRRENKT